MAMSHHPIDANDEQPLIQFTEAMRQKYADMQSAKDSTEGVPTSSPLFALSDLGSVNDDDLHEVDQDKLDDNQSNDDLLYDDHSDDNMFDENKLDDAPLYDDGVSVEWIAPTQSDSLPAEGIIYERELQDEDQSTPTEFGTNTSPIPSGLVVSSRSISPTGPTIPSQILSEEMNLTAPSVVAPSTVKSPDPRGLVPPPSTPNKPAKPSTSESPPELSSYEIAKIIRDAIDNLPPGSLVPLEESMFAPGSKRNLEYKASLGREQAAGKRDPTSLDKRRQLSPATPKARDGSLLNMSSHITGAAKIAGDARVVDWNDPQRLVEANKPEQTDIVLSNRFSPLSCYGNAEKYSRTTQKSPLGPGLHATSPRPMLEESQLDDPSDQVHTYSPGPGIILTFRSAAKRPLVNEMPRLALNPGSAPFIPSSTPPAQVAKPQQLPPHLRYAQGLDITKQSKVSMAERHASEEFDDVLKADTSKALHKDQRVVEETSTLIKLVTQPSKGDSDTPSSSSSHVENNKPSTGTNKVAPHLRKTEPPTTMDVLLEDLAKSSALTVSPLSSTEKLAPHLRKFEVQSPQKVQNTQEALSISLTKPKENLPVSVVKPKEVLTLSPLSSAKTPLSSSEKVLPHMRKVETSGQFLTEGEATNLEEALYFAAWPKSEARDTPSMFSYF
jgi:hypothetical protein